MSVSVFFSNKNIQIVTGRSAGKNIRVDRMIETPMPENAILNGVVLEGGAEAISKALKEIWTSSKLKGSVDLIINSPQFISNRTEIPFIASTVKSTQYLDKLTESDEFGRFEDPLKGWYLLETDSSAKVRKVVTELAERKAVEKYIRIFSDAGISLRSVHDGVPLATELLSGCIGNSSAIYMIFDSHMLVTILYVEGKYYYDSTRRIFQARGTQEFSEEIRNNISGIKQFANSEHIKSPITDVYFAGLDSKDVSMLKAYLEDAEPSVRVHGTDAPSHIRFKRWGDRFSGFIYPVSGLISPDKGFSVLTAAKKSDESYAKKRELIKKAVPLLTLTFVMTLITAFMGVVYHHTLKRLDSINSYNSDITVIQSSNAYDDALRQAAEIGETQGGVNVLREAVDSYPIADSSVNNRILDAASADKVNIEFNSYDSTNGIFSITASSYEVEHINRFIAKLLSIDIFEDVDYTGYEWNDETETWSIKVICTLSAGSGEV